MKIKKTKFAKLLTLTLPIAAISIVTPVVLTSCGSSSSNGGSGNNTQSYNASWDTTKIQDGLTFDTTTTNNSAVITLKDDKAFAGTNISKKSTFDQIKESLDPSATGTSLYSVLSGAIKDVNNYNVSLSVDTNPVVFDYTNDSVGNYFEGQFVLTPKAGVNATAVNLKFRVNNFNDSYNGETGKTLTWDVDAIEKALKAKNENDQVNSTGNNLPEVTPKDNGSSVTIDLKNSGQSVGLGKVMDELCKSTISTDELQNFIKNSKDNSNYDFSKATISSWAPSVDETTVFTRIVVPSKELNGRSAILYLAYTGFTKDDGNAVWNRNITYPGGTNSWDSQWKEPIIDLSKVSGNIGDSSISNSSTLEDITNKDKIDLVVQYMVDNYIMGSQNFTYCFTGIKDGTNNDSTIVEGSFDSNGNFNPKASKSAETKNSISTIEEADSTTNSPLNGKNAVEFKIFLMPKQSTTAQTTTLNSTNGIWRSFYIIDYKTTPTK